MEKKLDLLKKELFCPPMVKMLCNGGFWFTLGLNVPRRNLILCIHIVRSSPLLLIVVLGLAIRIESFSVVQRSHLFPPLEKGKAFDLMLHLISGVVPVSSFTFQTYVESVVAFLLSLCFSACLCSSYLSLNVLSVSPKYVFMGLFWT